MFEISWTPDKKGNRNVQIIDKVCNPILSNLLDHSKPPKHKLDSEAAPTCLSSTIGMEPITFHLHQFKHSTDEENIIFHTKEVH